MRKASLQTFALCLGFGAIGCSSPSASPIDRGMGGASTSGFDTSDGSGVSGPTSGSVGSSTSGGSVTVGSSASGSTTAGGTTLGSTVGTSGGNTTAGNTTVGNTTTAGNTTAGPTTGGFTTSGSNNTSGGNTTGGGGAGGASSTTVGSTTGGNPTEPPDCNAQMPSGGTQHSNNGTGGDGNLAWEIWSNTGNGQLTTFDTPAFIATWNNSGGYLGRMGFEWNRFGDTPVPHDQRGTITAQYVANKSGSAGGYSYVGMYGWTTNPCVEWYIVDDSYNNMPINPGGTTNEGEVEIDGGTYIMYTRPTTGTGGDRCGGLSNWIQYYSVRRTARDCGVISLTQHFNAWQSLGMDMTGELLEAKILAEVGGGVGNVEFPVANVTVQ